MITRKRWTLRLAPILLLAGCAHPPQLTTKLDVQRKSDGIILVTLRVSNLENGATVPIAVEVTGQARTDGRWSKPESLIHPAAFVLNRKEQRDITKLWRIPADAVRTTLVIKEQENGHVLRSEKAEKIFGAATAVSSPGPLYRAPWRSPISPNR